MSVLEVRGWGVGETCLALSTLGKNLADDIFLFF